MSTWLSEKEFRQSGAESAGITINVAFLQEIKSDFGFRDLLNDVVHQLKPGPRRGVLADESGEKITPRVAAEMLGELRDGLETYFALEEFYGYFEQAEVLNPCVSQQAFGLQSEHETLFLKLNQIVETTQQIVYHEAGPETTLGRVAEELESFCIELAQHEQAEMDLMMRLCNEDFGVGD
jgi:hypothetical protein